MQDNAQEPIGHLSYTRLHDRSLSTTPKQKSPICQEGKRP
jgi:hypothetical protein